MQKIQITLSSIQDIRTFVNAVTLLDYEVDLEQGRYIVDAKSIMGIFALDTLSPITLVAHSDNTAEFFASIAQFIVKG
jgi:phosphotransferase system HPr-like phosphotransfer protein